MDNPKVLTCCGCSALTLILAGVYVIFSFSSLDATEYGLDYNSITKSIDQNVFTSGYHFLGFAHSFIKFPSTVQTMEFSNERTANRPPI